MFCLAPETKPGLISAQQAALIDSTLRSHKAKGDGETKAKIEGLLTQLTQLQTSGGR